MLERLQNIDRRIIYAIVLIAMGAPLLNPLMLPLSVGGPVNNSFAAIEALQPGDVVVLSYDYGPTSMAEVQPQADVFVRHLFQKDVKVVFVAFWAQGPMLWDITFDTIEGEHDKVYGEDYVTLGYNAGAETAISAFAADVHKSFPKDTNGTRVEDIPMMADIKSAEDWDLFIGLSSGTPGYAEHVRQIQNPYGTKMVMAVTSVSVASLTPYYQAGQLEGYLNGLRGAAEYELAAKIPGAGAAAMDALSMAHLAIIFFILVGNIAYFMDPNRKKA